MMDSDAKSCLSRMLIILASIVLLLSLAPSLRAQRSSRNDPPQQMPQQRNPEMQIRSLESGTETARSNRDPQLALAEVNEDFSRLRVIDEELKAAIKQATALDYKRIAEASAEVKKRATRLKSNLVFPQPPKNENRPKSPDMEGDEFNPLLAAMDKRLASFLGNPIFSDTGALDMTLANKARYDLDDILKLSDKLRKSAEKMSKQAAKP